MKGIRYVTACAVLAATVVCWGIGVTSAAADTSELGRPNAVHAIRDTKVDTRLTPAQRARAQRAEAIRQRKSSRQFILDVAAGKEPASSGSADKGGGK